MTDTLREPTDREIAEAEAPLAKPKKKRERERGSTFDPTYEGPTTFATREESRSYANATPASLDRAHAERQENKRKKHLAEWLHWHFHREQLYQDLSQQHRWRREALEVAVGIRVATQGSGG